MIQAAVFAEHYLLGNFMSLLSFADDCFQKYLLGIGAECQKVWIQIQTMPDIFQPDLVLGCSQSLSAK